MWCCYVFQAWFEVSHLLFCKMSFEIEKFLTAVKFGFYLWCYFGGYMIYGSDFSAAQRCVRFGSNLLTVFYDGAMTGIGWSISTSLLGLRSYCTKC